MKSEHDRAFKEWAVACEAMGDGRQILLIRKGGIREEGGVFRIDDPEFFLMPTYEHQKRALLRPEFVPDLEAIGLQPEKPDRIVLSTYAVVDHIAEAQDEEQVARVAHEGIWNETYIRQRFDFNPYDPLYLVLLRVYRLPEPYTIPMRPAYIGCKSWVTLEAPLSTKGAIPALSDEAYQARRDAILQALSVA